MLSVCAEVAALPGGCGLPPITGVEMNTRRLTLALPQLWSQRGACPDDDAASPTWNGSQLRAPQGKREELVQGARPRRHRSPESPGEAHQPNVRDAVVLGSRSVAVSIGLPKHSIPDVITRDRRLKHLELPPVSLGENSLNLHNTPIQLVWGREHNGGGEPPEKEGRFHDSVHRDEEQILRAIQFPTLHSTSDDEIQNQPEQSCVRTEVGEGSKVVGRKTPSPST